MDKLILDTCFLIDYQREAQSREPGPVHSFLSKQGERELQISTIAWGEFLAGFPQPDHPFVRFAHDKLEILPVTEPVASTYRKVYRSLKAGGQLIGANDLWIASHALYLGRPLVSRNRSEYNRVPDLQLLTY